MDADAAPLMAFRKAQKEEVELLLASTSDEEFHWRGSEDDLRSWKDVIADKDVEDVPPFAYAIRLAKSDSHAEDALWMNVEYIDDDSNDVSLRLQGPSISKDELARVQSVLDERKREAVKDGLEHIVFDVYTTIKDYLSEQPLMLQNDSVPQEEATADRLDCKVRMSRVIFWSHHLKAPSKKRDMTAWCSELSLWGLVKSGYPAYLCFEGQEDDVAEIVKRIKALQWHAITVKTEQPYSHVAASSTCTTRGQVQNDALRSCALRRGHSLENREASLRSDEKVRTTMDEVESGKELIERFKLAGLAEDEYMYALNLRKRG